MKLSFASTNTASKVKKYFYSLCACSLVFSASSIYGGTIFATGDGKTPGAGVQDDHWQVVAVPSSSVIGAVPNAFPASPPYGAYVPATVSPLWLGGSNNAGDGNGAHWVSLYNNSNLSAFGFGNWQPYSFVLRQQFTINADDFYVFNFFGTGDDYMAFFINGSVQNVAPTAHDPLDQGWFDARIDNFPTIVGGTQITTNQAAMTNIGGWGAPFGNSPSYDGIPGTSGNGNFGSLSQFTGTVYLTAGIHYAYAVVYDTGGEAGAIIGESSFNPVPEPSSMVLLLAGAGLLALRRRAKLKVDRIS